MKTAQDIRAYNNGSVPYVVELATGKRLVWLPRGLAEGLAYPAASNSMSEWQLNNFGY